MLPFISDFSSGKVDFKSSPNWPTVLNDLENSSAGNAVAHISDTLLTGSCKEEKALPLTTMKFTACQSLLDLLCCMPKGHLNSRSFSHYVTSIVNLERYDLCSINIEN